ncbi:MAG: hypothetical protein QOI57_859 [Rubrobacteraceae bacterium]|nr:hypothetical protein [Rubrobacteraceae bacterium]
MAPRMLKSSGGAPERQTFHFGLLEDLLYRDLASPPCVAPPRYRPSSSPALLELAPHYRGSLAPQYWGGEDEQSSQ